jgi:hypothetical protein
MWLALSAAALGAPVVAHGVDADAAVAAVLELDPSFPDAAAVSWDTVRATGPAVLEGGTVVRCDGATRGGWLARALADARSRLAYGEWQEALDALRDAEAALPCAPGDAAGSDLAGLFSVRGVAAFHLGRTADAAAAFAALKAVAPTWAWDASLSPQARPAFDATPAPPVAAWRVAGGTVTVDGRPSPEAVPAGWHLVTAADPAGAWGVTVRPGNRATLVLPERFGDAPPAEGASDPSVPLLFAAAFGEGMPVALVTPSGTWVGVAGRSDWTFRAAAQEPEPTRRSRAALAVGLAGSGAGAAFGALAIVSLGQASAATAAYRGAATPEDAALAEADHQDAAGRLSWSRWVALGGGLVAGTGFGVHVAGALRATPAGLEARF